MSAVFGGFIGGVLCFVCGWMACALYLYRAEQEARSYAARAAAEIDSMTEQAERVYHG